MKAVTSQAPVTACLWSGSRDLVAMGLLQPSRAGRVRSLTLMPTMIGTARSEEDFVTQLLDWLFTMLTRRVALRIDQDGVTLGRRTGRTDPHRQCAVVRHCANRAVRAEAGRTDPDVRAAAAA